MNCIIKNAKGSKYSHLIRLISSDEDLFILVAFILGYLQSEQFNTSSFFSSSS